MHFYFDLMLFSLQRLEDYEKSDASKNKMLQILHSNSNPKENKKSNK